MTRHASLTGAHLHHPLGSSVVGELQLTTNTSTAYNIIDASSLAVMFRIDTTTGSQSIKTDLNLVQINTDAAQGTSETCTLRMFTGSGATVLNRVSLQVSNTGSTSLVLDTNTSGAGYVSTATPLMLGVTGGTGGQLGLFERTGNPTNVANSVILYGKDDATVTNLYAIDSAGTVYQLTGGASIAASSTTAASWTINSDATAAVEEYPFLVLMGGDGTAATNDDIVKLTATLNTDSEILKIVTSRSRNGGAYATKGTAIYIGDDTSTANNQPSITFWDGDGAAATRNASITWSGGGSGTLTFNSSSGGVTFSNAVTFNGNMTLGAGSFKLDNLSTPSTDSSRAQIWGDDANSIIQVFAKSSDGSIHQLTGEASGSQATASGRGSKATGTDSTSFGFGAEATGTNATVFGEGSTAGSGGACIFGSDSAGSTFSGFVIGHGISLTASTQGLLGANDLFIGDGGVSNASPGNKTVSTTQASGSDVAGGSLTLITGLATGNSASGSFAIKIGEVGSTGSTLQTAVTRLSVDNVGNASVNGRTNGQAIGLKSLTESHTLAAAATSDTTITIPADALVVFVSVRVTTAVTTSVATNTFDYGVAGATTRYGDDIAGALNTTNKGRTTDAVSGNQPLFYSAATAIRFSAPGVETFTAGVIRVTIHYIDCTAPTS